MRPPPAAIVSMALLALLAAQAPAQPTVPVIHDPWLNWDFIVPAGLAVNDVHVVVANPTFVPGATADDPLLPSWVYDGVQNNVPYGAGQASILSWSNGGIGSPQLPGGTVIHFGADMLHSGGIIDAYWTLDGNPVAKIPIIWEITRVWPWDPAQPTDPNNGLVEMGLRTTEAFLDANPGSTVQLENIRTWIDIPAADLGLEDINRELDELLIGGRKGGTATIFDIDSFFDVYFRVETTEQTNPSFESLLIADVVVTDSGGTSTTVGTFWNLNPQCPEPGTLVLLAVGAVALLRRRRR